MDTTIPEDEEGFQELNNLSNEDLYKRLGSFEQKGGLPSDLVNWGKERLINIINNNKNSICSNETVRLLCKNEEVKNQTEIILAIVAILKISAPVVPYVTVSILITRYGIDKICKKQWQENGL